MLAKRNIQIWPPCWAGGTNLEDIYFLEKWEWAYYPLRASVFHQLALRVNRHLSPLIEQKAIHMESSLVSVINHVQYTHWTIIRQPAGMGGPRNEIKIVLENKNLLVNSFTFGAFLPLSLSVSPLFKPNGVIWWLYNFTAYILDLTFPCKLNGKALIIGNVSVKDVCDL